MGLSRVRAAAAAAIALVASIPMGATAGGSAVAPASLSMRSVPPPAASSYGNAVFGRWHNDRFGLPSYRYDLDPARDPRAKQAEIKGRTDAWHQVGNDYHHAFASNAGFVQLWSQARTYEFTNWYDEANRHYAGGFGWLRSPNAAVSTLYGDRPAGSHTERDFGIGYFHHRTTTSADDVNEYVYAPYGTDPILLHDVTITNRTRSTQPLTWFEYWDVNPRVQPGFPGYGARQRGFAAPTYDPASGTVLVQQLPEVGDANPHTVDTSPLAIFAAPVSARVTGFDTDTAAFFGSGSRSRPAVVASGRSTQSLAPAQPVTEVAPGRAMAAFRSPLTLRPGQSVTLRYAYGTAHATQVPTLLARYRTQRAPLTRSEASWRNWVPRADLPGYPWLERELQWDAYMVRSRATPEEACHGRPSLSQGGYYQYSQGYQGAFRDPLQHMLPMVEADPGLARGVIAFSAQEQMVGTGAIPYGMQDLCTPYYFGGESGDFDAWLLWASAEYVLATKDVAFLDTRLPYQLDQGSGTLWDHLKLAHFHMEHVIGKGPHGMPTAGTMGDWADFGVVTGQMTESTLETEQLIYAYRRLADVADLKHDSAFASQLRADASRYTGIVRGQWTGGGWYSRSYSGTRQNGATAIDAETQSWPLIEGLASTKQAGTLVKNFRHYLTGVGMKGGPTRVGSSLLPPPADPVSATKSVADAEAAWWAINEPMVWAYTAVDDRLPQADSYAWDEFLRGTLANLATVHPDHWDGVISVDDVCDTWWSPGPYTCGVLNDGGWYTQILHQPSWELFAMTKLAGLEPTRDGYRFAPHVPLPRFAFTLPDAGIAQSQGVSRGYVRTVTSRTLQLQVRLPAGARLVHAWVGPRVVAAVQRGRWVTFTAPARAHAPVQWELSWK